MTDKQQISAVIATFADRRHAEHFVDELQRAGFKSDQIEVHCPHSRGEAIEDDAVAGAITGGMVGATAGALATGLIPGVAPLVAGGLLLGVLGGTAAGATTGGVLGALAGLGIPEEKARHHEQEFLRGRTLVVVQALGRGGEAMGILGRCQKSLGLRVPPTVAGGTKLRFLKKLWQGTSATDYRNEGETCLARGDYDKAITDFTEAIRLDPHNAAAYLDRGLTYEEEGQYQEAISDYDMAIRLDPGNAASYLYRGNAYFAQDDLDQAVSDYTAAIRLDPNLALAYYYRGLTYTQKGDAVRGQADQQKALQLDRELHKE